MLELLIAVAIISALTAIAVPLYSDYVLRANVAQTKSDIVKLSSLIDLYYADNKSFPASLNDVGMNTLTDPWGHTYRYLNIATAANNEPRQDRNMRPVNTDYDLYSLGANGVTHRTFTNSAGKDDIVRANNGAYIGYASEY